MLPFSKSLVLAPGNLLLVQIWFSIQVANGLLLSLAQKQHPHTNTQGPEHGNMTQSHKNQKDKSKNMT